MINQLRADFYRQTHTWGIYILGIIVILISSLTVKFKSVGGVMTDSNSQVAIDQMFSGRWTHLLAMRSLIFGTSFLLYAFIIIFVIIFGTEFTKKTYKNSLTSGISRTGFFLAKYLMMLLDIIGSTILYFFSGILTSCLVGNKLGTTWHSLISTSFWSIMVLSFFISAIFSAAVLLLLATNSIIVSSISIIIFSTVVSILHSVAHLNWLRYLDFFGVTTQFAFKQLSTSKLFPYLGAGCILLIICYGLSLISLKRKEL